MFDPDHALRWGLNIPPGENSKKILIMHACLPLTKVSIFASPNGYGDA
jgi:hypothetical protein